MTMDRWRKKRVRKRAFTHTHSSRLVDCTDTGLDAGSSCGDIWTAAKQRKKSKVQLQGPCLFFIFRSCPPISPFLKIDQHHLAGFWLSFTSFSPLSHSPPAQRAARYTQNDTDGHPHKERMLSSPSCTGVCTLATPANIPSCLPACLPANRSGIRPPLTRTP
jgi:hypothetical protein